VLMSEMMAESSTCPCESKGWIALSGRGLQDAQRQDAAIRELGPQRFAGGDGVQEVLTTRLRKLSDAGVLQRIQYSERPPRSEYQLTQAGLELAPTLLTLL
jgi:HxlR-like helix-turn-helix protein